MKSGAIFFVVFSFAIEHSHAAPNQATSGGAQKNYGICDAPKPPEGGGTSSISEDAGPQPPGTMVRYSCPKGTRLIGVLTSFCLLTGTWLYEPPKCTQENKDCSYPDRSKYLRTFVGNQRYRGEDVFPHGTVLLFHCEPLGQYELRGYNSSKCVNGRWSNEVPECYSLGIRDVVVRIPPSPDISVSSGGYLDVHPGTQVQLLCVTGTSSPKMFIHPRLASWNVTDGGKLGEEYLLSATFQLPEIYEGTIRCLSVGRVKDVRVRSRRLRCNLPEEVPHAKMDLKNVEFGAVANYECVQGFVMEGGHHQSTCRTDGHWSRVNFFCREVMCDAPEPPRGGGSSSIPEDAGSQRMGTTVRYSCPQGSRLVGSNSSSCQPTGLWSHDAPKCTRKCFVPEIEHATLLRKQENSNSTLEEKVAPGTEAVSEPDMLILECDSGFEIQGQKRIQMRCEDGVWHPGQPNCTARLTKDCLFPHRRHHLKAYAGNQPYVSGAVVPHGTALHFYCEPLGEFHFRGHNSSQCIDGTWSQEFPYCYDLGYYDLVLRISYSPELAVSPDGYLNVSPDAEVELTCSCAAFNPTIQSYPAILNWKVRENYWKTVLSVSFSVKEGYDGVIRCWSDNGLKEIKLRGRRLYSCVPPYSEESVISRETREIYAIKCKPPLVLMGPERLHCLPNGEFDHPAPYCTFPKTVKNPVTIKPAPSSAQPSHVTVHPAGGDAKATQEGTLNDSSLQGNVSRPTGDIEAEIPPTPMNQPSSFTHRVQTTRASQLQRGGPPSSLGKLTRPPSTKDSRGQDAQNKTRTSSASGIKITSLIQEPREIPSGVVLVESEDQSPTTLANADKAEIPERVPEVTASAIMSEMPNSNPTTTAVQMEASQLPALVRPDFALSGTETNDEDQSHDTFIDVLSVTEPYIGISPGSDDAASSSLPSALNANWPRSCSIKPFDLQLKAFTGNQRMTKFNDVRHGTMVKFHCEPVGEAVGGPAAAVCNDGNWTTESGTIQSDIPVQCRVPRVNDPVIKITNEHGHLVEHDVGPMGVLHAPLGTKIFLHCGTQGNLGRRPVTWTISNNNNGSKKRRYHNTPVVSILLKLGDRYDAECHIGDERRRTIQIVESDQTFCDKPVLAPGVFVSAGDFSYLEFGCEKGLHLKGSRRISCTRGGWWDKELPICSEKPKVETVNCDVGDFYDVVQRDEVILLAESAKVPSGTILEATCESEGFVIQGKSSAVTCLANGMWSFAEDIRCIQGCENFRVKDADLVIEGSKSLYEFGDSITLFCPHGMELQPHVERIVCLGSGWSESALPKCVPTQIVVQTVVVTDPRKPWGG